MPDFRMRRDSLNNRVLYAYWILEHTHKPVDGLIAPTPLATDQAGLADLFSCAEDSVHETTRRTIYWFLQAGFLVLANNGFYSYLGGVCKTYYVNYRQAQGLDSLPSRGRQAPQGMQVHQGILVREEHGACRSKGRAPSQ